MNKFLALWALLSGLSAAKAAETCPPAKIADLQKLLQEKPASELIFFASWCISCKEHLQHPPPGSFFIASFDERAAANKVIDHFRGANEAPRCVWDEDGSITEHYQVKGLPATRSPGPPKR